MKARTLLPLVCLALACSSSKDKGGLGPSKGSGGSTGSGASDGTGGSSTIVVSGGTSGTTGTSSGGTDGTTAGSSGMGQMTPTPDQLRANECAGWSSEPELLPIVLMLVVDTSASMNDRPAGATDSKWNITRDALATAVNGLPATAGVGVLYFPNKMTQPNSDINAPRDVSACVNIDAMIPIDLLGNTGSQQRSTISSSLDQAKPNGSTPTHDAYDYAYVHGMQASKLTGNRFMLLITDGAPTFKKNCEGGGMPNDEQPTQPIIDEILAARQAGTRTFIIGSPGSEEVNGVDTRPWLALAAVAGGTAPEGCLVTPPPAGQPADYCHIDLSGGTDFAGALNAALARILGLITSCTFDVPATGNDGQPVDRNEVNVIYTPGNGDPESVVGRNDAPDCTDGWQFDADGRVVLCTNTCFTAQNDPMGKIELIFGCNSISVGQVK
ncbi:MAG TPA: vWA domain-containing protein [Polyangiaceae bacterium]|nr:vWA domain-containing protein [Polyangiaceae bacterium]